MSSSSNTNAPVDAAAAPEGEEMRQRKKELRKLVRSRLKEMSQDEIQTQSELVWNNLFEMPEYKSAQSVGLFLSMPKGEIVTDTALARVLDDKKTLYVPRVGLDFEKCDMDLIRVEDAEEQEEILHGTDAARRLFYHDWPRNKWGIPEPPMGVDHTAAQPGDIDLLVVPGLAFDDKGGRLGQGKGYYDRFITKMRDHQQQQGDEKTKPLLVAVGLEASFLKGDEGSVPMSAHDFPMDALILPDGRKRISAA